LIVARRWLLLGRLHAAAAALAPLDTRGHAPALVAVAELSRAELDLRSLNTGAAQAALERAQVAAERAAVPALLAKVAETRAVLGRTAARCVVAGIEQPLRLAEVEALLGSGALVLDACRRGLRAGASAWPLARRPVLFALALALAESWPGDVEREILIERVFRTRDPDETHRARLRVEIGRLRALVKSVARIEATPRGFVIEPLDQREVVVLLPPIAGEQAALLALLADGAAWSTSALALALQASQRTVQRALANLESQGQIRAIGRARKTLAGAAAGRIHDDLVTPSRAAAWIECLHRAEFRRLQRNPGMSTPASTAPLQAAEIVREYGPFDGTQRVNGVSHDGHQVWAATDAGLIAFDPASGEAQRRLPRAADAGTAFDGSYLYQIAESRIDRIDPATGAVLATIPAPGQGGDSGLTWAEGSLWIGQYRDRKIHQIDPETGAIQRTIESNRFVTGVTWVDGELWHATYEDEQSEPRRVQADTGAVLECLQMPAGLVISGLEPDGADLFYCGGGSSGKVRAVRRPQADRS
jgi:hypothetical protein